MDDRFPVRSICGIFVVCRSISIPAYPCSISTIQKTHILEQAHARTRHGVFDTCHQHVLLLALVRLLGSQLSYAGLLYIMVVFGHKTSRPACRLSVCKSVRRSTSISYDNRERY
ncbi:TPA: hypothetical protein ACH3X1_009497 [Trebouxia sp. C0004]